MHDLDPDLHNRPTTNVDMPIERPHTTFYVLAIAMLVLSVNNLPGGRRLVCGVTILFDQVLVVREVTPGGPEVEVYVSNMLNLTGRLPVDGLVDPIDLTSCNKFRCVYATDWIGIVVKDMYNTECQPK